MSETRSTKTPEDPKNPGKSKRLSNAELRRRKAELGRQKKRRYYELKKGILEKEKTNGYRLAAIKTVDGWWRMFDNSALIYTHKLAPRLNQTPKFWIDKDYEHKARLGYVTFNQLGPLETNLKKLKIFVIYRSEDLVIFDLGVKYTEQELKEMETIEDQKWEQVNRLVMPKEIMPGLKSKIKDLTVTVFESVRKMDKVSRTMFGDSLNSIAIRMLEDFLLMANGWKDKEEYFDETLRDIRIINAKMLVASDLRVLKPQKVKAIMEKSHIVRGKIIKEANENNDKKEKK